MMPQRRTKESWQEAPFCLYRRRPSFDRPASIGFLKPVLDESNKTGTG
jgi:hypothetical protein